MKNADDVLVSDHSEPVLTDDELEVIYEVARRIARKPRNSLSEKEEEGPDKPWWVLLGIIFSGSCITMFILLILTMPE